MLNDIRKDLYCSEQDLFALHLRRHTHTALFFAACSQLIYASNIWCSTKHLIITLFSIYKLKFIEFHVILLLLDESILLNNLFTLVFQHFQIFWSRGSLLIQFLNRIKSIWHHLILFIQQIRSILEFSL